LNAVGGMLTGCVEGDYSHSETQSADDRPASHNSNSNTQNICNMSTSRIRAVKIQNGIKISNSLSHFVQSSTNICRCVEEKEWRQSMPHTHAQMSTFLIENIF